MDPEKRLAEHRRPASLEQLLAFFAERLEPVELAELGHLPDPELPIVLLMGCARSGTTLAFQYLATSGCFAYPSNLLSRFYFAPYLGRMLQRMLVEEDFRGELLDTAVWGSFESNLGKTKGPLAPHEFWYFWRRFFKFGETQRLSEAQLARVDTRLFLREFSSIQVVDPRPMVAKGMICNWNIPFLAAISPRFKFVWIVRDTYANAQSLLDARCRFSGDKATWYSFKPPGYEDTLPLSPLHQTTWQVLATNQAIQTGLDSISSDRVVRISYEDFCQDPLAALYRVQALIGGEWSPVDTKMLPARFEARESRPTSDWPMLLAEVKGLIS